MGVLFARYFKQRLSIYIATDDYQPDLPAPTGDDPELQRAFCDHIVKEQGLDRSYFANEDQLARAILKEDWPKKRTGKPIALPYPSLGGLFKSRDEFLKELHTSLSRGSGRTAIVGSALYGLGGIGKTRAAVEYAWAHQDDYTALLFVIAESPEALRRNLTALAGPLVLDLPEQHATEEDVRLKAAIDSLKLHPGWFLVLDNVDTAKALKETDKLLGGLTGGRVVVTSRLANFAGANSIRSHSMCSPLTMRSLSCWSVPTGADKRRRTTQWPRDNLRTISDGLHSRSNRPAPMWRGLVFHFLDTGNYGGTIGMRFVGP
jgi:hypothetical protein